MNELSLDLYIKKRKKIMVKNVDIEKFTEFVYHQAW